MGAFLIAMPLLPTAKLRQRLLDLLIDRRGVGRIRRVIIHQGNRSDARLVGDDQARGALERVVVLLQ